MAFHLLTAPPPIDSKSSKEHLNMLDALQLDQWATIDVPETAYKEAFANKIRSTARGRGIKVKITTVSPSKLAVHRVA